MDLYQKRSNYNPMPITKCLYVFDPLKPHFYIVKLGFTGTYIIFLISAQTIDWGYSLEPPRWGGSNEYPQYVLRWGGSNEYPQSMFLAEMWKNIFIWFIFWSVYLNSYVFVMQKLPRSVNHFFAQMHKPLIWYFMQFHLVEFYYDYLNCSFAVKKGPCLWGHNFYIGSYKETR